MEKHVYLIIRKNLHQISFSKWSHGSIKSKKKDGVHGQQCNYLTIVYNIIRVSSHEKHVKLNTQTLVIVGRIASSKLTWTPTTICHHVP